MRTVIFLSTLILPTSLFAATLSSPVAEFRAEARVSVNISAEFVGSGEDASGFLLLDSMADLSDSDRYYLGNSTSDIGIVASLSASVSASASGTVSSDETYSSAYADVYLQPYYHYSCTHFSCANGDMIVSLEFAVEELSFSAANEVLGSSAMARSDAFLSMAACPNNLRGLLSDCEGPIARLLSLTGSGVFQTQVSPGGWVSFLAFSSVGGEARYEEPSVVPLPASATSLLAAFGLLGAAQMRNRRHRRQGLS